MPAGQQIPGDPQAGKPVTFKLLVTTQEGGAVNRGRFNRNEWWPALTATGAVPRRKRGQRQPGDRTQGMHVLRHTAASVWLSGGADIVKVAAWLGDTVQTVWSTYAHFIPDADDRGRKAMDLFFTESAGSGACARIAPSGEAI